MTNFFDPKLLSKYDTSGPRYTSYPTAVEFKESFDRRDLERENKLRAAEPLSVYIHIPFCHSLCYYCGCNKIVTRHSSKADIYLDYLEIEISQRAKTFGSRPVHQLHLGGGTPSFLSAKQLTRLMTMLKKHFVFSLNIEMSIEIDPRKVELELAVELAKMGFNRLSIGVQDTNENVQRAINREQSTEFISLFVQQAEQAGFESINVDLIYGLPHQTKEIFSKTLFDVTKELDPDRISLFSYAHMPVIFPSQRKIRDGWLPSSDEKLALMKLGIETLTRHGYELIGMDHFAKPDDELARAQREGKLHRNFQGYTTHGEYDLLGFGTSAISSIGRVYSQNTKSLTDYYRRLDEYGNAVDKGKRLSFDDLIRRQVIKEIMCNLYLDKKVIERLFDIRFDDYFSYELVSLSPFIHDGLVTNNRENIRVSPEARLLVRNICMSFDAYLKNHIQQKRFSRVI
ncbi:oxygen-independent coproporphyrinogen III oxidase [Alteromonadaceae bacterium M269]|nr:oxygen-independent coproporphyrinogen III oxidase [Alteromonadaceae bacterium M269]